MSQLLVVAHEATRTGSPRVLLELLRRTLPGHRGEVAVRLLAEGPLADELRALGTASPIGFRPDVALLNSAPSAAVALELAADVRVVAYVHEEGEALRVLPPEAVEGLVGRCDRVLCVSEAARADLAGMGVRTDRLEVLPPSVPTRTEGAVPDRTALAEQVGADPSRPLVVGCGEAGWRKGADLFVDAARRSAAGATWVWVGRRPRAFGRVLDNDVAVAGLAGRVRWAGEVADKLDMSPEDRAMHERRRAEMYRGVVEDGEIHSQPFSEGLNPGALAGTATRAVPVDGGYLVTGRKIFASLSGAADRYNVTCQVEGEEFLRLLSVRANADGVEIVDDWDPLGMRGTVSRTLLLKDAFVPADDEILPGGMYDQAARRYPYLFMSLAPSYLGLTKGILDFTRAYLRGEVKGAAKGTARRDNPIKQYGWAEMQIKYEQSRAMLYSVVDNATLDPTEEQMVSAWAAVYTTMEHANEVAAKAVRVCGGQSMLRHMSLERMYRDSRLGSTMLPWSAEVALDRIGKARLYDE